MTAECSARMRPILSKPYLDRIRADVGQIGACSRRVLLCPSFEGSRLRLKVAPAHLSKTSCRAISRPSMSHPKPAVRVCSTSLQGSNLDRIGAWQSQTQILELATLSRRLRGIEADVPRRPALRIWGGVEETLGISLQAPLSSPRSAHFPQRVEEDPLKTCSARASVPGCTSILGGRNDVPA